jgi:hypothetical protein
VALTVRPVVWLAGTLTTTAHLALIRRVKWHDVSAKSLLALAGPVFFFFSAVFLKKEGRGERGEMGEKGEREDGEEGGEREAAV